jgi:hypothetical protein
VNEAALVLIVLGLVTQTAFAIATYRVAEVRALNARVWGVIGFLTGVFGLVAVCVVRGRPPLDEEDAQA